MPRQARPADPFLVATMMMCVIIEDEDDQVDNCHGIAPTCRCGKRKPGAAAGPGRGWCALEGRRRRQAAIMIMIKTVMR